MDRSQLPPQFTEIFNKYTSLTNAYQAGQIDNATYQSEIKKLVFKDEKGQFWWLGTDGTWFWNNGQTWVPRDPLSITGAGQHPIPPPGGTSKKKKTWLFILIPGILLFVCLCIFSIFALSTLYNLGNSSPAGNDNTEIPLDSDELMSPTQQEITGTGTLVSLSSQQQSLVNDLGYPDAFSIVEVETDKAEFVRLETWIYYVASTSYTFSDGNFKMDGAVEDIPDGFIPAPHHPDQFPLGVSLEQIRSLLPDHDLSLFNHSDAFQEGVQLYVSQQLVLSFRDNRLFYVEAFAFVPEGSE